MAMGILMLLKRDTSFTSRLQPLRLRLRPSRLHTINAPTYIVFHPDSRRATPYTITVKDGASVQGLLAEIRRYPQLKQALKNERISLYQCGTLANEPPNCDDPADKRYKETIELLRAEDNMNKKMDPQLPLKHYLPSGPASFEDNKIDVVIAPKSILDNVSVANFLSSTSLRPRRVMDTRSKSSHPFDTMLGGQLIDGEHPPYYLAKFDKMAQSMTTDLFDRVLPKYPVVDQEALQIASFLARVHSNRLADNPLTNKSSVSLSTLHLLRTCIFCAKAVGLSFDIEMRHKSEIASVIMDSRVISTDDEARGGIAVEDKSPKVFRHHVTDFEVNQYVGRIEGLESAEFGFWGILLKLAYHMINENLQWGMIHSGELMRIVRIERKEGRPYLIISEEIPVASPAPGSMYSLICYILLTSNDGDISIFEKIKADVPAPLPVSSSRRTTHNHSSPRPDIVDVGSSSTFNSNQVDLGNPSRTVLHKTAAGGSILIKVPMIRLDTRLRSLKSARDVNVYITDFLGAGEFGRVYRGDAFTDDKSYCGSIVVKLSDTRMQEYFAREAMAYNLLDGLYGTGVPRYYGHFHGSANGLQYCCILLSDCGEPLDTFDDLSFPQRIEIFRIFCKIHQAGVAHNDIKPDNVMLSKWGMRVIDFSHAISNHQCKGVACKELLYASNELKLTRDHVESVLSDVYHEDEH